MRRTLVIDVAGLSADLVSEMPCLKALAGRGACLPLEPVLPATTLPMQATLTTGEPPARHGVVSNGFYFHDTAEVRFWEQSSHLIGAPRAWQRVVRNAECGMRSGKKRGAPGDSVPFTPHSELRTSHLKVGMLFWQLAMYDPTVSVLLTPKPVHAPGRLLQDCYSRPADLYHRLAEKLGPFDLMYYWSPMAGMASSRWIAQATLAVWRDEKPDLLLTYLPQLDYSGHRAGPDAEAHRTGARELDALIAPLIEAAESTGGRAVVLSEYSFVPVFRAVAPNRALREAGFLAIREIALGEYLVPGDSRAFAMVDNQVAHVYFPASPRLRRAGPAAADLEADVRAARKVLESVPGVAAVLDHEAQAEAGLRHARSGELVLLAEPDAHFTYYWWLDDGRAPAFAPTVDIHAKPGFDPAELLFDLKTKAVPLSADAIQGSHGLVQASGKGWGAFLDTAPPRDLAGRQAVQATEVARLLVPPV